jgi:hypothetical protein
MPCPTGKQRTATATTGYVPGAAGADPGAEPPARGQWGRDSPMIWGVLGGIIPPEEIQRPAAVA